MSLKDKSYCIIGGGGFLGRHIVDYLINRGEKNIVVFDMRKTFDSPTVRYVLGDITKFDDLVRAFEGITTVIHTASPTVDVRELLYKVNVDGTKNVIQACIKAGVKQLVYTSSASVCFDGTAIKNGNEDMPFCKVYPDPYSETKAIAEKSVLEANGKNGLMTCAIRACGLFGPHDVQGWPGFMEAGKAGKSVVQIGDGSNLFDWTYVENTAYGHVLAADKMVPGSTVCGQAYLITNDNPIPFWDMARFVYKNFGFPEPKYKIPYIIMWYFAVILSWIVWILSPLVKIKPTFTPIRVANAGVTRTFCIDKAKKDLGYKPLVSMQDGLTKTLQHFKEKDKKKL